MVIVLPPLALSVILDIAVVVATLSRALMNAYTMQVVRHVF